jgi:hypothetical protein
VVYGRPAATGENGSLSHRPQQFRTMQGSPLQTNASARPWQFAAKNGKRGDLDQSFVFAVNGVKMRRLMVVVVKPDGNSEKSRNLRHLHSNCISILSR